jgi:hypothetical protein
MIHFTFQGASIAKRWRIAPMPKPRPNHYTEARRIVKAELARRGVNYKQLAKLLPDESYVQLKTKINRGSFSAAFFITVMRAIGAQYVDISPRSTGRDGAARRPQKN